MDSSISLLILTVVGIAIGYFSAVLISNLRNTDRDRTNDSQPREPDPEGRVEAFRVWRSQESKLVQLEIEDRLLESSSEMTPAEHAVISLALVDLYDWMSQGSSQAEEDLPPMEVEDAAADGTIQESDDSTGSDTVEAGKEAPAADEPSQKEAVSGLQPAEGLEEKVPPVPDKANGQKQTSEKSPVVLPSINIFKSLVHTARSEIKEKVEADDQSIAFQVDEILQAKLEQSDLKDQAIRLLDLPGQGMVILIGLEKYDDIEAVPDEEIKKLLRESVAEWETAMLAKRKKNR